MTRAEMTDAQLDVAQAAARAAALAAGALQRQHLGAPATHKGEVDLVTAIDLESERIIRAALTAATPEVPILAEEGGGAWSSPTRWIVDPLDGTTNFVHGLPHFAVSIALQIEGELALGLVYDPCRDELFEARRGAGLTLNGRPVGVSARASLNDCLIASGFPYDRRQRAAFYLGLVRVILEHTQGFRRAGAAALDLAWVACGRLDAYFEIGLSPWDVAAGALLVTEGGGRVSETELGPLRLDKPRILASNGRVHEALAALLAPHLDDPR